MKQTIRIKSVRINTLMEKYVLLKERQAKINKELDAIADEIKELFKEDANYKTNNVTFELTTAKGSDTINKDKLKELFPKVFAMEELHKIGKPSRKLIGATILDNSKVKIVEL